MLGTDVASPLTRRFFANQATILYYHGVFPAGSPLLWQFGGMPLDTFAGELRLLLKHFRPVSLAALLELAQTGARIDDPVVSVTFDDGCDTSAAGLAEVLSGLGIPATTFVVTDCIDNRHLMWHHGLSAIRSIRGDDVFIREFNRLSAGIDGNVTIRTADELRAATIRWPMHRKDEYVAALWRSCAMPPVDEFLQERRPYVTWTELSRWCASGHAVGFHTRTHAFCSALTDTEIATEIVQPAAALASRLGASRLPFAYPFGDRFSAPVERHVAAAAGFTCMLGIGDLSRIGTAPGDLTRIAGQEGLTVNLFSRPIARAVLRFLHSAR